MCASLPEQLIFPGKQAQIISGTILYPLTRSPQWGLHTNCPEKYQSREENDDHLRAIVLMYHLEKEILKKGGKEKRKHKKSSCHNSINTNSMLSEIMFTSNFHEADSYSQKNFPYPQDTLPGSRARDFVHKWKLEEQPLQQHQQET